MPLEEALGEIALFGRSMDVWPYEDDEKEIRMGRDCFLKVMRDIGQPAATSQSRMVGKLVDSLQQLEKTPRMIPKPSRGSSPVTSEGSRIAEVEQA